MCCWNFTFWDNDGCVEFLVMLLSALGIRPVPDGRPCQSDIFKTKLGRLFIRHTKDEYEHVYETFNGLTAGEFQRAQARNPRLKEEVFAACRQAQSDGQSIDSNLCVMGLQLDNLWTLIHMHLGLSVDDTTYLDRLAKVFDTRENGGTYSIHPYLGVYPGIPQYALESIRNRLAPKMKEGVDVFKRMVEGDIEICSMQLAFFGPVRSVRLWESSKLMKNFHYSLEETMWAGTPSLINHALFGPGIDFNQEKLVKLHPLLNKA